MVVLIFLLLAVSLLAGLSLVLLSRLSEVRQALSALEAPEPDPSELTRFVWAED